MLEMYSPCLLPRLCAALLALLLTSARGQDMHELLLQVGEKQANHEALHEADPAALRLKQVQESLEELGKLWTVYLPDLMEGNGLNLQPLTPKCNESAAAILKNHGRVNVTIPELAVLVDASGKPGPGILDGNLLMYGAYDECFAHNFTSYCLGKIHLSSQPFSSPYAITVGLCVPKYCTEADVGVIVDATQVLYVTNLDMGCMDQKTPNYSPGAIAMLVVCGVFALLVLAGSLVDKMVECMKEERSVTPYVQIGDNSTGNGASVTINNSGLSGGALGDSEEKIPLLSQSSRQGAGHGSGGVSSRRVNPLDFLTAFSLYKTVPTLLATKQAPGVITSLNGLRVMSMFWVILGHVFVMVMSNVDNPTPLFKVASRFTFQAVGNGFLSVDSFFFLSGTLVAYLTFRQMKKNGRFPFLHYYLHRYLRLTPVYAFVLFFAWTLTTHLAPAPIFNLANLVAGTCHKYWWTNLLYINNFHPWKLTDECIAWTWYLANDMQFYIIAPLILLPLYYLVPVGMAIAGALLLGSFVVTATLAGVYNFPGNQLATLAYHFIPPNDKSYEDLIYVKPWGRISPYIVGLLLGYLLYRNVRLPATRRLLPFSWLAYLGIWVCSGVLLVSSLYGLYFTWHGHIPSVEENVIYITFGRFAWGLGLALLVFCCHNGYGGVINAFLSCKIWTPLSRMTYNAYMVHLVVMTVVYSQLQTSLHYTDVTIASYTVAFVVISYGVAAVLCVCVEFPLGTIEMLLFKLAGLGGRESQRQVDVAAINTTAAPAASGRRGEGVGEKGVA